VGFSTSQNLIGFTACYRKRFNFYCRFDICVASFYLNKVYETELCLHPQINSLLGWAPSRDIAQPHLQRMRIKWHEPSDQLTAWIAYIPHMKTKATSFTLAGPHSLSGSVCSSFQAARVSRNLTERYVRLVLNRAEKYCVCCEVRTEFIYVM
jgi:hypothetical protein